MDIWLLIKLRIKLFRLNRIPSINCGGCAIVAYSVQKWLQNEHKVKSEVIYIFRGLAMYSFKEFEKGNNGSCSHALIRVNNTYYDTNGSYSEKAFRKHWRGAQLLTLSKTQTLNSINNSDNWNCEFNRERYVPRINRILGTNMKFSIES